MNNFLEEALSRFNIPYSSISVNNQAMTRWGHNKRYWARAINDGYVFGDFVESVSEHIFPSNRKLTKKEWAEIGKATREAEEEQRRIWEEASLRANNIWNNSVSLISHAYLYEKKIHSYGLRLDSENRMLIPAYDEAGKLWSLQRICSDGEKKFLYGGRKKGCFYIIDPGNKINASEDILICEGYATGASLYECTSIPTIIAFDTGNLKHVCQAIKKKFKDKNIVVCADNDQFSDNGHNPGIEKAEEAALFIEANIAVPKFTDESVEKFKLSNPNKKGPTDFNDLHMLEGKDVVISFVQACESIEEKLFEFDNFILKENGLFYISKDNEKEYVSNYFKVVALTKDIETDECGKLIEFRSMYDNKLMKIRILGNWLSRDGEIIRDRLTRLGFRLSMSPRLRYKFNEYINMSEPNKFITYINKVGWHNKMFVLPGLVVGSEDDNIVYETECTKGSVSQLGALNEWKENIAKYCVENSRLVFAVSTAFASILMKVCDIDINAGFHFVGSSSIGKTTCLKVAASVFGSREYIKSWRTTDNGLEGISAKHNDCLLILDEIGQVDSSKIGDIAYMLASGSGKTRSDIYGDPRDVRRWRLLLLSTGEIDLATHMAESRKITHAGQEVRLINIQAKPNINSHGIFENIHGFENGASFVDYLSEVSNQYYGTPIVEFIKQVIRDYDKIKERFRKELPAMKSVFLPKESEEQDERVFKLFSFIGFAGELASEYSITGWDRREALKAAVSCFNSWMEEKDGAGNQERRVMLDQVKLFFELYSNSRIPDIYDDKIKPINAAGYKQVISTGETLYYIFPKVFKHEICKGLNHKTTANVLKEVGWIIPDGSGTLYGSKRIQDKVYRVYVFSQKLWEY
jgi:putative DNA primase/helicase